MALHYDGKLDTLADIMDKHKKSKKSEAKVIKWIDNNNIKFIQSILFDNRPLSKASAFGYTEVVKRIVDIIGESYTTIDEPDNGEKTQDYDTFTPLYYAIENGHIEIIKILIEKGAYNCGDRHGPNPFFCVLDSDNYESVIKKMLKVLTKANVVDTELERNVNYGNVYNVKLLIKAGINVDEKILNIAIKRKNMDINRIKIIKLLLNELMY